MKKDPQANKKRKDNQLKSLTSQNKLPGQFQSQWQQHNNKNSSNKIDKILNKQINRKNNNLTKTNTKIKIFLMIFHYFLLPKLINKNKKIIMKMETIV